MSSISPSLGVPLTNGGLPPTSPGAVRQSATDVGQTGVSQATQTDGSQSASPGAGSGVSPGVSASGNVAGSAAVTPSSPPIGAEALKKLVSDMQARLAGSGSSLEFSVDPSTGRSVVTVTERSTNQVIWQFPSEQALQVSKALERTIGGFVNRTA